MVDFLGPKVNSNYVCSTCVDVEMWNSHLPTSALAMKKLQVQE